MANYFDDFGKQGEKEEAPEKPKSDGEPKQDGDEGVTMHVHKKGHKFHSKVDKHDGYPPDEADHDSPDEAHAAMGQALEEKYGAGPTEEAEEKVSPGIHDKVGGYFQHMQGMK